VPLHDAFVVAHALCSRPAASLFTTPELCPATYIVKRKSAVAMPMTLPGVGQDLR